MFYHIYNCDISDNHLIVNKSKEETLVNYICPFINKEVTLHKGEIFNMAFPISMRIFRTDVPVTTDWPVNVHQKIDKYETKLSERDGSLLLPIERILFVSDFKDEVVKSLESISVDFTDEIYKEAVILIDSGEYKDLRRRLAEETYNRYAFFICPFGDKTIDDNYEFVIKPVLKSHRIDIQRADEIASAGPVTEIITNAIFRSRLVVADLTYERPNCYYEVGFAHALGKPVIILAQEGSHRHFDISVHQWNYWKTYKDLKSKFEKAVDSVLMEVGFPPKL
jgi:hypothetical protein